MTYWENELVQAEKKIFSLLVELDKTKKKLAIALEALEFAQDNSNSFIANTVRDAFMRIEYENER